MQDFLVSNAAQMLLGETLEDPDKWRGLLSVLCRDIPICLMLFFGFLYCLATPIGPSRPFKGAFWKELKAFFHDKSIFSRRNALILLGIFAISFAGYFALLRGGESYWDDISRQSSGSFGWAFSFGRIATEVLNLAIHGAFLIHDRSPLEQLIAMGFLSAAALAMALAFKGLPQTGGGKPQLASRCRRADCGLQPVLP